MVKPDKPLFSARRICKRQGRIEVDDLDQALKEFTARNFEIVYRPRDEAWGVRRFFVRDPFGNIVNILFPLE